MTPQPTIIIPRLKRILSRGEILAASLDAVMRGNPDLGEILLWAADACPELVIPVEEVINQGPEETDPREYWTGTNEEVQKHFNGIACLGIANTLYNAAGQYTGITASDHVDHQHRYWLSKATLNDWKSMIKVWRKSQQSAPAPTKDSPSLEGTSPQQDKSLLTSPHASSPRSSASRGRSMRSRRSSISGR